MHTYTHTIEAHGMDSGWQPRSDRWTEIQGPTFTNFNCSIVDKLFYIWGNWGLEKLNLKS
jgi:hypothetical protein